MEVKKGGLYKMVGAIGEEKKRTYYKNYKEKRQVSVFC